MKLGPSTFILIVLAVLTATELSSAQTTAITEQDYWAGARSGYAATSKIFPRRETEIYERLSGGKVTDSKTVVSEYQSEDTYRTIETAVWHGKTTVTESIQIGTDRYCRINSGKWKTCFENPPDTTGFPDETTCSFQQSNDGITFIRTALWKKKVGGAEPTELRTEVDRLVINTDRSVRARSSLTTVDGTNNIVSRETSKFEYGVTLMPIKRPVK